MGLIGPGHGRCATTVVDRSTSKLIESVLRVFRSAALGLWVGQKAPERPSTVEHSWRHKACTFSFTGITCSHGCLLQLLHPAVQSDICRGRKVKAPPGTSLQTAAYDTTAELWTRIAYGRHVLRRAARY